MSPTAFNNTDRETTVSESNSPSTPLGAFTKGVALIHRRERDGYHELWMVTSSRKMPNGDVKASLLGGHLEFTAAAKATFKGGVLPDNWRIFGLTQPELERAFDSAPVGASEVSSV